MCMHLYVSERVWTCTKWREVEIASIFILHSQRWQRFDIVDVRDRKNRYESLVPRTRVLFFSHDTPTTPKECTLYSRVTQSWHDEGNK